MDDQKKNPAPQNDYANDAPLQKPKKLPWTGDLSLRFPLEEGQLIGWLNLSDRHNGSYNRHVIFICLLVLLAVNYALTIPRAESKLGPVLMTILCAVMIGMIGYNTATGNRRAARQILADGTAFGFTFQEEGFVIDFPNETRRVEWHEKVTVHEFEAFYSIRYRDRRAFAVPKETLSEEQQVQIGTLRRERLGKDYKYCA